MDDERKYYFESESSPTKQLEYAAEKGASNFTIILKPNQEKIPRNYPKLIKETFDRKITNVKNIEEIIHGRNGSILAITGNLKTAKEISAIKLILGKAVTSSVQIESITIRFLLFNISTQTPIQEIKEQLEEENDVKIHSLRRFTKKNRDTIEETETVLVTIYGRYLPEHVKLYMINRRIQVFIDRPRQCKKCYEYDHPIRFCKSEQICKKCGEKHLYTECQDKGKPKCALCNGEHQADDKECPNYKKEEEIQEFKALNGLSNAEARRRTKSIPKSYAKAVTSGHQASNKEIEEKINKNEKDLRSYVDESMKNHQKQMESFIQTTLKSQQEQMDKFVQQVFKQQNDQMNKAIQDMQKNQETFVKMILQTLDTKIRDALKEARKDILNSPNKSSKRTKKDDNKEKTAYLHETSVSKDIEMNDIEKAVLANSKGGTLQKGRQTEDLR